MVPGTRIFDGFACAVAARLRFHWSLLSTTACRIRSPDDVTGDDGLTISVWSHLGRFSCLTVGSDGRRDTLGGTRAGSAGCRLHASRIAVECSRRASASAIAIVLAFICLISASLSFSSTALSRVVRVRFEGLSNGFEVVPGSLPIAPGTNRGCFCPLRSMGTERKSGNSRLSFAGTSDAGTLERLPSRPLREKRGRLSPCLLNGTTHRFDRSPAYFCVGCLDGDNSRLRMNFRCGSALAVFDTGTCALGRISLPGSAGPSV